MIFLWTAWYGLTFALAEHLSPGPWLTPVAMGTYLGLLVLWIIRTGRSGAVGLCLPRGMKVRSIPELLPLLVLPAYNLATGTLPGLPTVLLMLSISAAEEIFFRGFLLQHLLKWGKLRAVLLTALIFALFHGVNLIRGGDLLYTAVQILCAFFSGLCFSAVTVRWGSLFPSIAAHVLTNITGAGDPEVTPGLLLCMGAYGLYGIRLIRNIRSM